jgi:outer membrane receptor for ferrienterochelin and colicin
MRSVTRPSSAIKWLWLYLTLCVCTLLAKPGTAAPGSMGAIAGEITDALTRQPISNAQVTVEELGLTAASDGDGRFGLHALPPGAYRLLIEREGFAPYLQADVIVLPDRDTPLAVRLALRAVREENVEVRASAFSRPPDVATSAFTMSFEELRRAPGAAEDVSRALQALPGLAARNDMRNDLVTRGGSPSENLTIVDGFEVPTLSHFATQGASGGPINMLNAELIRDVSFMAGGFPAPYGGRLSSVLDVSLREGNRQRAAAELDLGMAGAGFVLEGPLGRRGSWIASARRSYVDLFLTKQLGTVAIPEWVNYQAKASYDLGRGHKLTFLSLGGWDRDTFDPDLADLDEHSVFEFYSNDYRSTNGLRWQSLFGRKGFGALSLVATRCTFRTDTWDKWAGRQLVAHNRSTEDELGLKYDATFELSPNVSTRFGASATHQRLDYEITQPIGLENPFSLSTTRVDAVDLRSSLNATQAATYAQLGVRLLSRLQLTLGGRYDHFESIRSGGFGPRVSLSYRLNPRLELSAAVGRYFQNPPFVYQLSAPGNRALDPMRADHSILGVAYYPTDDLKLTIEAYEKRYRRYPVSSDYPSLSMANKGDGEIMGLLFPLSSAGHGQSRGIELYLQKKVSRSLYGQLSYAYARAEQAALDGVLRPSDFDLPHVLSLVGGYRFGKRLEIASRFTYTSGRPYTPFLTAETLAQNRSTGILDLTRVNAVRTPAYHRLDLRVDRRFLRGWGAIVLYLEVENLYGRKNVRTYDWNPKTGGATAAEQFSRMIIGGLNLKL